MRGVGVPASPWLMRRWREPGPMSVSWPDSIRDEVKAVLDDALHAVFEQSVPDPHARGELRVAETATVERYHDGRLLVSVRWPHSLQAYLDATDAGEDYLEAEGHAENPGMVVYHTLRDHGIPIPEDDPLTGVLFDRANDAVTVQALVDPADFTDVGGD